MKNNSINDKKKFIQDLLLNYLENDDNNNEIFKLYVNSLKRKISKKAKKIMHTFFFYYAKYPKIIIDA